ncbi:hypothetical protein MRB53_035563 [Persea americana]|uniref:Uncharacterized protein n=1 Tax=Persea americana TaxID=3435 RepID=A0ACC2K599_PERAE|nr:hypothetical protein MRB53_035563 [Persea americana]
MLRTEMRVRLASDSGQDGQDLERMRSSTDQAYVANRNCEGLFLPPFALAPLHVIPVQLHGETAFPFKKSLRFW